MDPKLLTLSLYSWEILFYLVTVIFLRQISADLKKLITQNAKLVHMQESDYVFDIKGRNVVYYATYPDSVLRSCKIFSHIELDKRPKGITTDVK